MDEIEPKRLDFLMHPVVLNSVAFLIVATAVARRQLDDLGLLLAAVALVCLFFAHLKRVEGNANELCLHFEGQLRSIEALESALARKRSRFRRRIR